MPIVLSWRRGADSSREVRRAVRALRRGQIVAFPAETGYAIAASAIAPSAIQRLPQDSELAVVLRGAEDLTDWIPDISPVGRRLARRCWPGPVALASASFAAGVARRLPGSVRSRLASKGWLSLRPAWHEALRQTLSRLAIPVVLADLPRSKGQIEFVHAFGEGVDMIVDDGPVASPAPLTVIGINGRGWEILREGQLGAEDVARLAICVVIFVCTGNTCRSPMAEVLCKKLLADRLGCTIEELPDRGFVVLSAGLAAMMGGAAAAEAVAAARELGADLSRHISRPLTARLMMQADHLVAMTDSHRQALAEAASNLGICIRLLAGTGEDIDDPIGSDQQVYRDCARQILCHLEGLLAELQPS